MPYETLADGLRSFGERALSALLGVNEASAADKAKLARYLLLLRQKEFPKHGMELDAFYPIPSPIDTASFAAQQQAYNVAKRMAEASVPNDLDYWAKKSFLERVMPNPSEMMPDVELAREAGQVLNMMELRSRFDSSAKGPFLLAHEEGLTREGFEDLLNRFSDQEIYEWMQKASPYRRGRR